MMAVVRTQAALALILLVALSFGCGKSETTSNAKKPAQAGRSSDVQEKGWDLPADFPKDVPIIEGATLKVAMSQGGRMIVHLYTPASIADAAKFYRGAFKARGWTIESEENTGEMFVVSAKKDRTLCGVTVSREGKRTLVRLAVSQTP
jgi:hypothetical protein